jgi:hypothetical protein
VRVDIQFCDHRTWDVNDQCPQWETYLMDEGAYLAPRPEINGMMGSDAVVRFDAYVSTDHVYLYTNKLPYACVELPPDKLSSGPVSVTFGDVLYHSGIDLAPWYTFHTEHMQVVTSRHFSNLGFSSGVASPGWNESQFPCSPPETLAIR